MKRKLIIVIIIVFVVAGIATGGFFIGRYLYIEDCKSSVKGLPAGFTYTAHTGCCGTEDNSIASITSGYSYAAEIVEFDLTFNDEMTAVLCHDEPVGGEVTLEEAFSYISQYDALQVNVDAKTHDGLWQVQEMAEKYGILDRIFFTGIEEENVEAVKNSAPDVPYYLNVDVESPSKHTQEYLASLVKKVKDAGAIGINFNKRGASAELVKVFHDNGLLVSIFTVDSELEMYKILLCKPDNITTRYPDKLQEILEEGNLQTEK